MSKCFLQGQYVITFTGVDTGVILCDSVERMTNVIHDIYPNPGCPARNHLLDAAVWDGSADHPDFPFHVSCDVLDEERGTTTVQIFRIQELSV
jgi:hypothetical protein